MDKLKTTFMGLEMRSPIIAGSSGTTSNINKVIELDKNGVGAIILKSIFEEQINMDTEKTLNNEGGGYPEAEDYIRNYVRANTINEYVSLVKEAKSKVEAPIIASISCLKDGEWVEFASKLEQAGADAIEINAFILPLDPFKDSQDIENIYFSIAKHIRKELKIPILFKIGHYFSNLPMFVSKLKGYGVNGITIFNKFFEPDIDINTMTMKSKTVFSTSTDISTTLRWTGILKGMDNNLEISASTGVHNGDDAIKLLLAGADAVQVCSGIYKNGASTIKDMNSRVAEWMNAKGFKNINDFRGNMSCSDMNDFEHYERAQFMKYFSSKKD